MSPVKPIIEVPINVIYLHGASSVSVCLLCSLPVYLVETCRMTTLVGMAHPFFSLICSLLLKDLSFIFICWEKLIILLFGCVVGKNGSLCFMMHFHFQLVSISLTIL